MLFFVEILTYFLVSSTGLIVNTHLFVRFLSKYHGSSEFSKLCLAKTIPNVLVCATFMFWSTPLSALDVQIGELPLFLSVFVGQVMIGATYVARPIIQVFMAINIWYLISFPLKKLPVRASSLTSKSILFMILIVTAYTVRRMIPCNISHEKKTIILIFSVSCGLTYKPQLLIWTSEPTDCSNTYGDLSTNAVMVMCIVSTCLSLATFIKLGCDKVNGLSSETVKNRRKKRIKFFIQVAFWEFLYRSTCFQSVCQDGLHLLDLFSWKVISTFSSAAWFQFTTAKLPLLLLHALDGFVMFYFHPEFYPKMLKKSKSQSAILTVQSITMNWTPVL